MILNQIKSFFSVSFDLVLLDENLPYDLYINSSSHVHRDRFVRIFPINGRLGQADLDTFKRKYRQLYILETQRNLYLKSLIRVEGASELDKIEVIKDSAIVYLNKVFTPDKEFTTEVLGEAISGCRDSVESMIDMLEDRSVRDVKGLIGSLSFHDFYTYDHSINVSMYCISILKAYRPQSTREELMVVGLGGLLHDLGKIKIPTHIINNPGKLNDDDFSLIKNHPGYGLDLINENETAGVEDFNFDIIKRVVFEHHENFNGTGYPQKIKGKEIHLYARICAIADFFDAITTKRSYHDVLEVDEALNVMEKSSGRKIDPEIFDVFVKSIRTTVLKGKTDKALADDFDPCQPHNVLPFGEFSKSLKKEALNTSKDTNFGKVSGDADIFGKKKKAS